MTENPKPHVIYEVTENIQNPEADRRMNDWNRQPIISKGRRVVITEEGYIGPLLNHRSHSVSKHTQPKLYALLIDRLEAQPATLGSLLLRGVYSLNTIDQYAMDAIALLIDRGRLSKEEAAALIIESVEMDGSDERQLKRRHGL